MQRAPQISVNEKTFRRTKRAQFNKLVQAYKEFKHQAGYTNIQVRDLAQLEQALATVHKKLVPWWKDR